MLYDVSEFIQYPVDGAIAGGSRFTLPFPVLVEPTQHIRSPIHIPNPSIISNPDIHSSGMLHVFVGDFFV